MDVRRPVRVIIVDDDEGERFGRHQLLIDSPDIRVVRVLSHAEALNLTATIWDDVDVVLLDIWWRGRSAFDEFAGVEVAQRIRAGHPRTLREAIRLGRWEGHVTLIAVSRVIDGGAVNKRLRDAGFDLAFDRDDDRVAGTAGLRRTVLHPEEYLRSSLAADTWVADDRDRELGLTDRTDLSGLVAAAGAVDPPALIRESRGPKTAAERRQWNKVRDALVRQFSLITPPSRQTGGRRENKLLFADLRRLLDRSRRPPTSVRDHERDR